MIYVFDTNVAEQETKCGPTFVAWNILSIMRALRIPSTCTQTAQTRDVLERALYLKYTSIYDVYDYTLKCIIHYFLFVLAGARHRLRRQTWEL